EGLRRLRVAGRQVDPAERSRCVLGPGSHSPTDPTRPGRCGNQLRQSGRRQVTGLVITELDENDLPSPRTEAVALARTTPDRHRTEAKPGLNSRSNPRKRICPSEIGGIFTTASCP